jgi:AcrR family transcriptional regulator
MGLTRERIVQAAIALLDADGLEDFNVRALGKRLASAATAMYWHVGSKRNLVALAGDEVWNEVPLPAIEKKSWRAAAKQMATGLHAMLVRHPWVVHAFGAQVLFGPGRARHHDHGLALYEAAGFRGARADQAATAVFTFVLGNALGVAGAVELARQARRRGARGQAWMRSEMAKAREVAEQFPRLRARLHTASAAYGASPRRAFALGLDALLDGLERQLRTRRR